MKHTFVATLVAAALFAATPLAFASSPVQAALNTQHDAYHVRFVDAHGRVELDARIVAPAGVVQNFRAEQDVPYVAKVASGRPLTPADLAVVRTGVWGSLLSGEHNHVVVSLRVATLESMHTIADKTISGQPIELPEVRGRRVKETVLLAPNSHAVLPIGIHAADGTLTIVRD